MPRIDRFTFLVTEQERQAIAELATRLQRSQSDAVRYVVILAAQELSKPQTAPALPVNVNEPQGGLRVAN